MFLITDNLHEFIPFYVPGPSLSLPGRRYPASGDTPGLPVVGGQGPPAGNSRSRLPGSRDGASPVNYCRLLLPGLGTAGSGYASTGLFAPYIPGLDSTRAGQPHAARRVPRRGLLAIPATHGTLVSGYPGQPVGITPIALQPVSIAHNALHALPPSDEGAPCP